jgi:uncharacterized protein DUF1259
MPCAKTTLDPKQLDAVFGAKGDSKEGLYKATFGRTTGINIVAIHQHMTGEEPRIVFLHYWGIGSGEDLSKGVRAGLDVVRTK